MMTLERSELFRQKMRIGPVWCEAESGAQMEVNDPASGEVIGHVPEGNAADTFRAIDAAQTGFTTWKTTTAAHRGETLERWYDLIVAHREDLARIMTREQGKPYTEALGEISYAASFVKWFSEEARRVYGETIPAPAPDRRIIVQKQPVGVCGIITPWNFPAAMITRKIAPALAAGCTVVIKPSEFTPFTALALAALAEEADFPPGAINVVTGDAVAIGGALTKSPTVRKISFTGSTRVGKLLMAQCAPTLKRVSLELGGNAPFLIFDDADLDLAVEDVIASKFRNGGQTCVCANRIYVQSGIYDTFAEKLAEKVAAMKVGSGFEPGVDIGPMINEAAMTKIGAHLKDAQARGGSVLTGGLRLSEDALFITPAVITEASGDMLLAREETFGPVAPLFRFESEEEALAAANDTEFGLASYLYTRDLARTFRVSEALESGMVSVNLGGFATEVAPFGGIKHSGLGREGARQGIDEYLDSKTLHLGAIA